MTSKRTPNASQPRIQVGARKWQELAQVGEATYAEYREEVRRLSHLPKSGDVANLEFRADSHVDDLMAHFRALVAIGVRANA